MLFTFYALMLCLQFCLANVRELDENFEDYINKGPWLINFYAHWCGYCRRLAPVFDEVGSTLRSISPTIYVGRIDVSIYNQVARKFRISAFPTICFVDGPVSIKYTGDRNARNIVTFTLRVHGPAVKHVDTALDLERNATFFQSDPFFVFIGDRDSTLKRAYHQVAEQLRLLSWFLSTHWDTLPERFSRLVEHVGSLEYALVVFKDDNAIVYSGWDAIPEESRNQHLAEWIMKERFPAFQKFELSELWEFGSSELSISANRSSIISPTNLPAYRLIVLFLVHPSSVDSTTATRLLNVGKSLARSRLPHLSNRFHFGWCDAVAELAEFAMIDLPIPGVVVVDPVTRIIYLNSTQPITTLEKDVLVNFLHSVSAGTVSGYGGNTFLIRLRRLSRRFLIDFSAFFYAHPLLSLLVLGIPVMLFSFIAYLCCCLDESYDEIDHPIVNSSHTSKRSHPASAEVDGGVVIHRGARSTPSYRRLSNSFTDMGPVVSRQAVEAKRTAFEEWKKTR